MQQISFISRLFPVFRPLRYLALAGLVGSLGALAVAATIVKPMVSPLYPESDLKPALPSVFTLERLEAYSGSGFDLYPDLVEFLDVLETGLRDDKQKATELDQLVPAYTRFVNPAVVQFNLYTIAQGENYWQIAKQHGYTIDTIVGCNPHLGQVVCYQGQQILLPSQGGSLHQVKPGETLDTVALDYGVLPEAISGANVIRSDWDVLPGMWLFIPGAKPRYLSESMHQQYSKRALFRSPLAGRYTSFVGLRIHPVLGFSKFHNGVDIACPHNTWVGAAAEGTVIASGWGGAVGKYIKIDHHNGYQTLYGHLDQIFVRTGQTIRRGQLIGRSGSTGRVTGPHLHFTIWERGRIKDPMDYLW
jgi:LysM repeat protein